ncbi:PTS sugar transporter subunit IIA [Streptococcus hongkongensis]|nr:PTS fructose transporter subunit IIA [Streptococcus uberis]
MDEELIFLKEKGMTSYQDVLHFLSQQLCDRGIVKEGFEEAILEREIIFPTGLQFEGYGVAIPHTDAEYVNETKLAIMTLEKPVTFTQMATTDQAVEVTFVMMLAIPDAHSQVDMLQKVISVLQDKETITTLLGYSANQKADFLKLLSTYHII